MRSNDIIHEAVEEAVKANPRLALEPYHQMKEAASILAGRLIKQNKALREALTDKECEQICKTMNMRAVHPALRSAIDGILSARAALATADTP